MGSQSAILRTQNLALGYGHKPIIHGLNLEIPSGQITVLVGPNGCGKSTLLRGLARLIRPQQGRIYLHDQPIAKFANQAFAQQVGILPQGTIAPEGLTVRELVAQGRFPYQNWWQAESKDDEAKISEALALTGLTELTWRPLNQLSGGQCQRVWIAMALAQDPNVLLLDEPTTFLDLAHQLDVLELLRQLNRTQAKTIVIVLHDLNQACRYADHLLAMRSGRVHAQGRPETVLSVDLVRQVFDLESCIITDPVSHTPLCIPIRGISSSA
ncbi:MAG: ABC transporter ATP-binding protein [Cyanobacteria bacterium P01_F01_bin.86]